MRVRIFPDGGVHSAYLDLVGSPPDVIEFVGRFKYNVSTSYNFSFKDHIVKMLDGLELPYLIPFYSDCFVHSCQKLLYTNADFVVDIEHGNPFMGSNGIYKYNSPQFRWVVKKLLLGDNCKMIMPWSETAANAFRLNFNFLGEEFLKTKVNVVNPTTTKCVILPRKFDIFTFIFIGGQSFYAKGGLQTLEAFKKMKINDAKCELMVVGNTPKSIVKKYMKIKGIWFFNPMPRNKLLELLARCHCLVLPSVGDTYGMVIHEAKARRIPAIVVDSFAAKELVENDVTGYVVGVDKNINPWFDEFGRKRLSKIQFHSQFATYVPSHEHVLELYHAMTNMFMNGWLDMSNRVMSEVETGRFSSIERNKKLKMIYEGEL
jgi:glycosyltransferase involved in cell wall biosynthesis